MSVPTQKIIVSNPHHIASILIEINPGYFFRDREIFPLMNRCNGIYPINELPRRKRRGINGEQLTLASVRLPLLCKEKG